MADNQEWSFADPPAPGIDAEYDGLFVARREAENCEEVLQIELAISILLLSRNYNLIPADYRSIFDFEDDRERLGAVQAAVSAMIRSRSRQASVPASDDVLPTGDSGRAGRLASLLSPWVELLKTVIGS